MKLGVLHRFESIGSTQDEAHRLASEGAPHGTAVVAAEQGSGRGSRGRVWTSGIGGLWLSVVCRPRIATAVEALSLRTGVALAELLDQFLPPNTRVNLKWPNDLMLADAKVGGILAEARWQGEALSWVIVGIGINVKNAPPAGLALPATSLALQGATHSAEQLTDAVVDAVSRATEDAGPLTPRELDAFRSRNWLKGRRLVLPHPGLAEGITATGRLQIRTMEGALVESVGTVQLGPAS